MSILCDRKHWKGSNKKINLEYVIYDFMWNLVGIFDFICIRWLTCQFSCVKKINTVNCNPKNGKCVLIDNKQSDDV